MHDAEDALRASAEEFRAFLAEIGETQSGFARRLKQLGDDRQFVAVLRTVHRIATGGARISGEMRVIMTMYRQSERLGSAQTRYRRWPMDTES